MWFTPGASNDPRGDVKQPLVALVAYVWNDRLVNLTVFDQNGNPIGGQTSVPLLQGDDPKPELGYFASWMPYQKGQAAKAEQRRRVGVGTSVIYRDGQGAEHAAIITRVYETGAIGVHAFVDDSYSGPVGGLDQVDPDGTARGWFLPRT